MRVMKRMTLFILSLATFIMLGLSGCGDDITNNPITEVTTPSSPENVQATPANRQIAIEWTPVAGATYYNIYWATEPGVDATCRRISTNQFPYLHIGLSDTTTYYYRISSVNSAGESALSTEISTRARARFSDMIKSLSASDGAASDFFGNTVSISGDYAIIGAHGDDDGGKTDSGAAYIFHRTGPDSWDDGTKITASDAMAGDYFGYSVSICGDYAIVGAQYVDVNGSMSAGAAYIFHRTGPNEWDDGIKIIAPDAQTADQFGCSVSISGDYAIVGALGERGGDGDPLMNAGAAYIYHRTGPNTWDDGTKIIASDAQELDLFGYSVSIDGDYVIVGSYWEDDGGSNAGAAYIFNRTGTNAWDAGTKIVADDAHTNDWFGASVSIHGDYAVVGVEGYDGGDGDPLANAGAVYIYHRTGANTWDDGTKIIAPDAQAFDYFGRSVSIYGDNIIVGAFQEDNGTGDPILDCGSAYIFHRTGTNVWDHGTKIVAEDAETGDEFGYSVSISGEYAIVGAHLEDSGGSSAGAAYIF